MAPSDLHRATEAAARRQHVLETGTRRRATVMAARRTGATIGTAPIHALDLELDTGERISVVEPVPLTAARLAVAGASVTVVVASPAHDAGAVVDWWASAPG